MQGLKYVDLRSFAHFFDLAIFLERTLSPGGLHFLLLYQPDKFWDIEDQCHGPVPQYRSTGNAVHVLVVWAERLYYGLMLADNSVHDHSDPPVVNLRDHDLLEARPSTACQKVLTKPDIRH